MAQVCKDIYRFVTLDLEYDFPKKVVIPTCKSFLKRIHMTVNKMTPFDEDNYIFEIGELRR